MSEYLNPLDSTKLFKQPSDRPLACSAYSLLNALQICGAEISSTSANNLISRVEETLTPLTYEDRKHFAQENGYTAEWLSFDESYTDSYERLIEKFAQELKLGPIFFSISTYLSKRDRTIQPTETIHANPELQEKEITHSIVATRDDLNIKLIDSFDPENPEIFTLASPDERLELAAWLVSDLFQHHPINTDQPKTKESVLQEARSILPEREGNPDFFRGCWAYAAFSRIR